MALETQNPTPGIDRLSPYEDLGGGVAEIRERITRARMADSRAAGTVIEAARDNPNNLPGVDSAGARVTQDDFPAFPPGRTPEDKGDIVRALSDLPLPPGGRPVQRRLF